MSKREEKRLVKKNIYDQLENDAKDECHRFCEQVCLHLPREIRDIVYDYFYADDVIYVGPEYFDKSGDPCLNDSGAHYWDVGYVGNDMKRELAENWYRKTFFYFYDTANNAQVVQRFLSFDRWGLGLKPHDFICKARFKLGVNEDPLHNKPHCCVIKNLASTLIKPLEYMEQLPNHALFMIRIHTYRALEYGCLEGEELQKTLQVLVEELKRLKAKGHQIIVEWSEFSELEFGTKSQGLDETIWLKQLQEAARASRQGPKRR